MEATAIPAETIKQFLTAAHIMLTKSGFKCNGREKAPRTSKTDRAFIYSKSGYCDVWLCSNLSWRTMQLGRGLSGMHSKLNVACQSTRLSDLRTALDSVK